MITRLFTSIPRTGLFAAVLGLLPLGFAASASAQTVFQAENATLSGGSVVESSNTGFLGSGYVNSSVSGGSILFKAVPGKGTSTTL